MKNRPKTKFARHKTYKEIKQQCRKQKVPLNDNLYVTKGWDTILVGAKDRVDRNGGWVIYNTFNGRFFGKTPAGKNFNSDETRWDKSEWMQALLNFFYSET